MKFFDSIISIFWIFIVDFKKLKIFFSLKINLFYLIN
jgi:hypothetical protein